MWWRDLLALGQSPGARPPGGREAGRPSLVELAPSLVVILGVAVAALIMLLGLLELRAEGDSSVAFRSRALSLMLAERLRATPAADRAAVIDKAAQRSGGEVLLVEQDGRVVVDGSLGAPSKDDIVKLLVLGDGETETRLGRTRFHAATLGAPVEQLALLTFVPAPRLPFATGSLVGSVAALTALLVGAAALVTYMYSRDVHADVTFVRERIVEMARENTGPSGKPIAVRDTDQVGILTSAFNELVERFRAAERAYQHDLAGALAYDRDRSAFLAALSHELRTPLNAILGFADVLLAEVDGPLSDDAHENLTVLRRSADHLRELIDDILDLSALESGELRLEVGAVDMFSLAAEVVREARVAAQDRALEVNLSGEPAIAWADGRRVRQILENLVGNAVKFTRQGCVTVEVLMVGEMVVVSVADTGPGIPADEQAAIFEEYRQTHASRQSRTGAGLGLAITRRLVRMHDGKIELESKVGEGTKFTVSLPIHSAGSHAARFISSLPPPPDATLGDPPG
jgi:signal transduction histidine kinase